MRLHMHCLHSAYIDLCLEIGHLLIPPPGHHLIGLDWIGLDWAGLDWIGLDWIGLDRIGRDWDWMR